MRVLRSRPHLIAAEDKGCCVGSSREEGGVVCAGPRFACQRCFPVRLPSFRPSLPRCCASRGPSAGVWGFIRGVWCFTRGVWCFTRGVWCFTRRVKRFTRGVWCFTRRVKRFTRRVKRFTRRVKRFTRRVKRFTRRVKRFTRRVKRFTRRVRLFTQEWGVFSSAQTLVSLLNAAHSHAPSRSAKAEASPQARVRDSPVAAADDIAPLAAGREGATKASWRGRHVRAGGGGEEGEEVVEIPLPDDAI
jgi:hypothetical protein